MPAGEIEAAVIDQLRAVFRQPEIVAGTWKAAQPDGDDIAEADVRAALQQLDPLWDELFPAEQARIVALLVERVDIGTDGLNVRFRDNGLAADGRRNRQHCGQEPESCCMTEQTVTVTVPFAVRKRGGRKLVITPDGVTAAPAPRANVDSALLKALARGFRWRKLLETGDYSTIEEIADAENINPSYVSRVLRMTLLAPEIVEAIVAGRQPDGLTMLAAMKAFPADWALQRNSWIA